MARPILAVLLLGGLWLGSVAPASAIDYTMPVVPPEFLLAAPPSPVPLAPAGLRPLALGAGPRGLAQTLAPAEAPAPAVGTPSGGVAWLRTGAPGVLRVIAHDQWSNTGSCAFWSWLSC